jgi:hypothetical protein
MRNFNLFALRAQERLLKLDISPEKRHRVLTRVLQDVNALDVLTPLGYQFLFEDEEDEDEDRGEIVVADDMVGDDVEARILQKQREYGIDPETPVAEGDGLEFKWGRTRLHEAVSLEDQEAIRQFLREGDDPGAKDNNGNTIYDLALLNDKQEIMKLLEELSAAI